MNTEEYDKVKSLAYIEYCDYLQQKYGLPNKPCMTSNWNRNPGISRTDEGLVMHHKKEDRTLNLADPKNVSKNPYKRQLLENLVFFDLLERLLLHVLICECRETRKTDTAWAWEERPHILFRNRTTPTTDSSRARDEDTTAISRRSATKRFAKSF